MWFADAEPQYACTPALAKWASSGSSVFELMALSWSTAEGRRREHHRSRCARQPLRQCPEPSELLVRIAKRIDHDLQANFHLRKLGGSASWGRFAHSARRMLPSRT